MVLAKEYGASESRFDTICPSVGHYFDATLGRIYNCIMTI